MRSAHSLVIALGLFLFVTACGGGGKGPAEEGGLVLSATSDEVAVGFTLRVQATSSDPSGGEALTWSTSGGRTATVDAQGLVLGCAPGAVTITARSPRTGARGTIDLRVVPDADFNTRLPADADPFAPTLQRKNAVEQCEVGIQLSGIAATVVEANHRRYHRLELPQAGTLGEEGRPELPFFSLYFAIPVDAKTHARATWTVEVERESPLTYDGIRPWPHQPTWWIGEDPANDAPPPHVCDEVAYQAQAAWPKRIWWAEAVEVGNLPLLEVRVVPMSYRPGTQILELFRSTRVRVVFEGEGTLVMPRPVGDYKGIQVRGADELVADFVQNADLLDPVEAPDLVAQLPPLDYGYVQDLPFDLLIVTHPDLYGAARDLAHHRQDQGVRVWLSTVTEATHPDAGSVLEHIRALDDMNRLAVLDGPRPYAMRALLIFGDVEHIPTFEGNNSRNMSPPAEATDDPVSIVGTDFDYSILHGGYDWRPDVALGRISVDDHAEGLIVVSKIEAYEGGAATGSPHHAAIWGLFDDEVEERVVLLDRSLAYTAGSTTVTTSSPDFSFADHLEPGDLLRPGTGQDANRGRWFGRVASVDSATTLTLESPWVGPTDADADSVQVGVQDGQDDWMFLETAERVRAFMIDIGVDVEWGYDRNDMLGVDTEPALDFDGDALHPDLVGHGWNCGRAEVQDAWKRGLDGIVLHSDHGEPEGWWNPRFTGDDFEAFTVADPWYPIVFSINCSSGFFDSETDRRWVWDPTEGAARCEETPATGPSVYGTHDVSFCESVLRDPWGGVAAVGGSRGTSSRYNDKLVDGLFGALYAEYVRGVIPDGPGTRYAYEYLGDVVRAAKFTMYNWLMTPTAERDARPNSARLNLQLYHLFGDPMLRVRPPQSPAAD